MTGESLPCEDHIARYCGYTTLSEDGKVSSTAFRLRKDKEQYLSVQWLECLQQSDRLSEIRDLRRILSSNNFKLGPKGKIAVLNVGSVCDYVEACSQFKIRVLHEPKAGDPSHSGIHDTIQDERLISELIAEKVIETYPAILPH